MDVCDRSVEPMDIDLSTNSVKSMDISHGDLEDFDTFLKTDGIRICEVELCAAESSPQELAQKDISCGPKKSDVNMYHINFNSRKIEKTKQKRLQIKFLLYILSVLCFLLLAYYVNNIKCSEELVLEDLRITLLKNLYGQDKAIDNIITTLQKKVKSKIMFFYGGTGVGKTFATTLILEKIWNYPNIYHYTMPSFVNRFSTDFMLGLTFCQTSMVIVDDLSKDDVNTNNYIRDLIAKSENLGHNITIVLIYNCDVTSENFDKRCDSTFYNELHKQFFNIKALKRFIKFEPLTEEHLRKCIERELGNQKVDIEYALNLFNISLDGCKGVHTKMKHLKII